MKWLILVVLVACGQAVAGDYCRSVSVHINGLSHHTGTGTYNETNLGLGGSCQYRDGRRWVVDAFSDSHEYPSAHAAHEWDIVKVGPVSAGVMAGLMYRREAYESTGLPVFPFALPYASVKIARVSINTYATPPLTEQTGAVFALQVRFALR